MLRKSAIFRNGKLWLLGFATMFPWTAQAQANDVAENQKIKTEQPTGNAPDSISTLDIEYLINAEIDDFIDTVRTKNADFIHPDSVRLLSKKDQAAYLRSAQMRPALIVVDTIPVDNFDDIKFEIGHFDMNLNVVRLNVFAPSAIAAPDVVQLCEVLKQEIRFVFFHEYLHYLQSKISVAGLTPDEMLKKSMHMEMAGRIIDLVIRREVFLRTKDFQKAFPLSMYNLAKEIPKLKKNAFHKKRNPFKSKFFCNAWGRSSRYASFLYQNPELPTGVRIDSAEADFLMGSVIVDANKEFTSYVENDQFVRLVKHDLQKSFSELIKKQPCTTYENVTAEIYKILDNEILNLISPDMRNILDGLINEIIELPRIQKSMQQLNKDYEREISFCLQVKTNQQFQNLQTKERD